MLSTRLCSSRENFSRGHTSTLERGPSSSRPGGGTADRLRPHTTLRSRPPSHTAQRSHTQLGVWTFPLGHTPICEPPSGEKRSVRLFLSFFCRASTTILAGGTRGKVEPCKSHECSSLALIVLLVVYAGLRHHVCTPVCVPAPCLARPSRPSTPAAIGLMLTRARLGHEPSCALLYGSLRRDMSMSAQSASEFSMPGV